MNLSFALALILASGVASVLGAICAAVWTSRNKDDHR